MSPPQNLCRDTLQIDGFACAQSLHNLMAPADEGRFSPAERDVAAGDSLESNIQLVLNNATLAAKTAVELCK